MSSCYYHYKLDKYTCWRKEKAMRHIRFSFPSVRLYFIIRKYVVRE